MNPCDLFPKLRNKVLNKSMPLFADLLLYVGPSPQERGALAEPEEPLFPVNALTGM